MGRVGLAHLPLHGGKAPRWLFSRMTALSREIILAIVSEYGAIEVLKRMSDPVWFQAFGCVLGFDWHSSGLTTTSTGAIKEGMRGLEKETGLFIAGGKGKTSRKTPQEIESWGEKVNLPVDPAELVYASRMSAKVDSSAIQDGYQLYHHTFMFTTDGHWAVVQQGMNTDVRRARRYHWLSDSVKDFVDEPHSGIIAEKNEKNVLDLTAHDSRETRDVSSMIASEKPEKTIKLVKRLKEINLPARHDIIAKDLRPESLNRILVKTYEQQPKDFEQLLGIRGVGPKTIRAITLISEVVHGTKPSYTDPVKYSFAHGGKDGIPYPVNRPVYDRSIEVLRKAVRDAKIGQTDRMKAMKTLAFCENMITGKNEVRRLRGDPDV